MKFKVSYKPLWKLLIDREMKNSELRERAKISPSTFYKMKNNENVTTDTLMKICSTLECDISDIIECIEGEHNMNIKSDVVAVSLFSGAGGLDIASFMAGVPVISSTDFEKDCIETL